MVQSDCFFLVEGLHLDEVSPVVLVAHCGAAETEGLHQEADYSPGSVLVVVALDYDVVVVVDVLSGVGGKAERDSVLVEVQVGGRRLQGNTVTGGQGVEKPGGSVLVFYHPGKALLLNGRVLDRAERTAGNWHLHVDLVGGEGGGRFGGGGGGGRRLWSTEVEVVVVEGKVR